MKKRPREESEEDHEAKKEARKKESARLNQMDELQTAFDKEMNFGTTTTYNPSPVTIESLLPFLPVMPSSAQSGESTVLHNLHVLGGQDKLGAPETLQARHLGRDVQNNGIRFFANPADREAADAYLSPVKWETEPKISSAEESIRKVIVDKAIKGEHEAPKFAGDAVSVARSWHLRAETYTTQDVNKFEKKLAALLASKPAARSAPKAEKKADKKAEKKAKKKAKA